MATLRANGIAFDELTPGEEFESPGRTITEADIVAFAALSGDWNQIHTDVEYCKNTPQGERVAHGLLGLTIASGLACRTGLIEGTVKAFTGLEWKFSGPILVGDTVRLRGRVMRTRPLPSMGGGMVVYEVELVNQRQEVVQKGTWSLLLRNGASAS